MNKLEKVPQKCHECEGLMVHVYKKGKKNRKIAKEKRRLAEVATEHYWQVIRGCVTRRAVNARFCKVDLFRADVMAKHKGLKFTAYTQVTTGQSHQALRERRRRLEEMPWMETDLVFLFEWRETQDPVNRANLLYFFRVEEYAKLPGQFKRSWQVWPKAVEVPREWLKAKTLVGKERDDI